MRRSAFHQEDAMAIFHVIPSSAFKMRMRDVSVGVAGGQTLRPAKAGLLRNGAYRSEGVVYEGDLLLLRDDGRENDGNERERPAERLQARRENRAI